jgi:hypothetical protein
VKTVTVKAKPPPLLPGSRMRRSGHGYTVLADWLHRHVM